MVSSYPSDKVFGLDLLDANNPSSNNEIAWGYSNKVVFVDRTGSMSSPTCSYNTGRSSRIFRFTSLKPNKKLIFAERFDSRVISIDYSTPGSLTEEWSVDACGSTSECNGIGIIPGTSKALITCEDHRMKLIELSDGSESVAYSNLFNFGRGAFVLQNHRIAVVWGDLSTSPKTTRISLWDVRVERGCHPSCAGCQFDTTSYGCTSCSHSKVLRLDGSCADNCEEKEYVDESKKCQKCHSTCLTCLNADSLACSSCPSTQFLRKDGSCRENCGLQEYLPENWDLVLKNKCESCHESCLTCSGGDPTDCSKCRKGLYKRTDGSCQKNCSSTEFEVAKQLCLKCNSTCLTCFGGDKTHCSSCKQGYMLQPDGSCLRTCPERHFLSESGTCLRCHTTCLSCVGASSSQCSSCDSLAFLKLTKEDKCQPCTRKSCPDLPKQSPFVGCLKEPELPVCPPTLNYRVSLRLDGFKKSGEISIYLIVELFDSSHGMLNDEELQFIIDSQYFQLKAQRLDYVGEARYDNETRILKEKGGITTRRQNSIEYLVYKAPKIPISNKNFR